MVLYVFIYIDEYIQYHQLCAHIYYLYKYKDIYVYTCIYIHTDWTDILSQRVYTYVYMIQNIMHRPVQTQYSAVSEEDNLPLALAVQVRPCRRQKERRKVRVAGR